jgi:hypothetical protein
MELQLNRIAARAAAKIDCESLRRAVVRFRGRIQPSLEQNFIPANRRAVD